MPYKIQYYLYRLIAVIAFVSAIANSYGQVPSYDWQCEPDGEAEVTASVAGGSADYGYYIYDGGLGFPLYDSYEGSNSSHTFSNIADEGTYGIIIRHNNGTLLLATEFTIDFPEASGTITIEQTLSCYTGSDAQLRVNPTEGTIPYDYNWSDGQTTQTAVNLAQGVFSVTVTDDKSCFDAATIFFVRPPTPGSDPQGTGIPDPLVVSAGSDQEVCLGSSVAIGGSPSASGGVGGFNYAWDNGGSLDNASASNPNASPLVNTTYTLTVTDVNLCTATDAVDVDVNAGPTANAGVDATIGNCAGQSTTLDASGSTGTGLSYAWDNGGTLSNANIVNPVASPGSTTTYTVTVTDANTCTDTDAVTVTVDAAPNANAGVDATIGNCAGQSTTLDATASTGTGLTYAWDNAGSLSNANIANPVASPGVTTTYTVTITDTYGCTDTDQVTVTVDAAPNANAGIDVSIGACAGQSTTLDATGSTGTGLTYAWDNAGSLSNANIANPVASPGATTTYTVTVTDAYGCTDTDAVTVTVDAAPNANAGVDATIGACAGQSTTLDATGSTGTGLTYAWDNAASLSNANIANPVASPGATTTYTVTVTDAYGCTDTDAVTVTVDAAPNANAGVDATIGACAGQSTTLDATGSTGTGLTYAWDNAGSLSNANIANPVASPGATTTYTVTVTDAYGCTDTDAVTVTVDAAPNANAGVDATIGACAGQSTTLDATGSTGTGITYAWDNAGSLSNANIANPVASPGVTTTYTVTVTDAYGCTDTDAVTVTVDAAPNANAGIDATIGACAGQSTTLDATGSTGTGLSYAWDNAGTLSNAAIPNPIASPAVTTTYTVTVTDAYGCTDTDAVTVTVDAAPNANAGVDATIGACAGQFTTLDATGSTGTGLSYAWDNAGTLSNANVPNPIATPAVTTTYTVTVTDAYGCTDTDAVTVTVDAAPNANAGVDATIGACAGQSTTLDATGSTGTGLSYAWDNAGSLSNAAIPNPVASPGVTTTYTVTITDAYGCTDTDAVTVTVDPVTADAGTDATIGACAGQSTTLDATGSTGTGITYAWDNAGSLSNANIANPVASPGVTTTYTVTVTDAYGCTDTDAVTVTVDAAPNANADVDATIGACAGQSTTLDATGSTGTGLTYAWDNAGSLSNANIANPVASPGATTTYTVTVTDAYGCTDTDAVTVTVDAAPNANAGVDATIGACAGQSTTLDATGSTGTGLTYAWDNAGSLSNANIANPVASPGVTTTYTVTVTDAYGCTDTDAVTVTVDAAPNANAGVDATIGACAGQSTTLDATGSTGTGITYAWDNAGSLSNANIANPVASPGVTTTYTVTVTDAYGCTDTDAVTVTVDAAPNANAGIDATIGACAGQSTTLDATGSTGTGLSYAWDNAGTLSNAAIPNPIASPAVTTTYTVTVTDAYGCTDTDAVTVTVDAAPNANAGVDATIGACAGQFTTLDATGSTGTGLSYAWDNAGTLSNANVPNPIATPAVTTTYTVTVTDAYGCTDTDAVTVTVDAAPNANAGVDATIGACAGQSTTLDATGSTGTGLSYAWDNAGSLSNAAIPNPVASPGVTTTYTVTITDAYGCTDTDAVTVTVDPVTADAGTDATIGACAGQSTTLDATGSTGTGLTYAWDNAGSLSNANIANPVASPGATTTYTVTVTDAYGCTDTDAVTVTVDAAPNANAGVDATIGACAGQSTTLDATGSTGTGLTYAWDNAGSLSNANIANPVASPGATTTYTVTVTDAYGCTDTDAVTVTVDAAPNANAGVDATIGACAGQSTTLDATGSTGTGLTYAWDNAGSLSNANIANPVASPGVTTTYTVTVTDAYGCTDTDAVTVTVDAAPNANAGVDATIGACAGQSTTLDATGSTGTGITYAWDNAGSLSNANIANPVASPGVTTTYTVTVTDAYGCTDTDAVTVTVDAAPNANAGIDATIGACAGQSTTLDATGSTGTGLSYAWDNAGTLSNAAIPNPIASPAVTTTYTVTVTDAYGCTDTDAVTVTVDAAPNANAGVDATIGACAGQFTTLDATGSTGTGLSYAWDNAGTLSNANVPNPIATPAVTTTYTVTVTDAYGCTDTDAVTVTVDAAPNANAGVDATIGACAGQSTTLDATGSTGTGLSYAWDNAGSLSNAAIPNPVASPGVTTTYTVTITDAYGCTDTDAVTVTVDPVTADAGTDATIGACAGQSTTLDATGSTGTGLTYAWDNAGSLSNANIANPVASPGATTTYTVTVTDAYGCTDTDAVTVTVDAAPNANAGVDSTIGACAGQSTTLDATGSTGTGLTYAWDNAGSLSNANIANPVASPGATTTYTVTVTDAYGCTDTDAVTVTVDPLDADAGADQTICLGDTTNLDASGTVGTGILINWNNAASLSDPNISNPQAFPTDTTDYILSITDIYGCTDSDTMTVNVIPAPIVDAGPNDTTICQGDPFTISNASASNYSSLLWTTSSGNVDFDDDGSLNTIFRPSLADQANGSVTLYLQASGIGVCNAVTDSFVLTIPSELQVSIGAPSPFIISPSTIIEANITVDNHQAAQDLGYYLVAPDGITKLVLKESPMKDDPVATCNFYFGGFNLSFTNDPAQVNPDDTLRLCYGFFDFSDPSGVYHASGDWNDLNNFNPADGGWAIEIKDFASNAGGIDGEIINASINFTDTNSVGDLVTITFDSGTDVIPIVEGDGITPGSTSYQVPLGLRTSCYDSEDAIALVNVIGGIPPYSGYDWSDNRYDGLDSVSLGGGTYTITVTDAMGCQASTSVDVNTPPEIVITDVTFTDSLSCYGDSSDISITVTGGTGAKEFSTNGVDFYPVSQSIRDLYSDTVTISIMDRNGCIKDTSIFVYSPDSIIVNYSTTDILCTGDSTGIIEINAEFGTPDYTFSLFKDGNPVANQISSDTTTFLVVADSNYTVSIQDANGCIANFTDTIIINEPPNALLIDTIYVTPIICNNDSATIEIIASGGTPGYEYSIMGDTLANYVPDSLFTGITEGDYYIFVKDVNGCTTAYSDTINIINPAPIVLDSTQLIDISTCRGDNAGEIIVYASGGLGTFEYSIDGGTTYQDTARFVNLLAGDYEIAAMDSLTGCEVLLDTVTIMEPDSLILDSYFTNITCNGYDDGIITAVMTGGTQPYTYELRDGFGGVLSTQVGNDTVTFTSLVQGNYLIYAYDANNCDTAINLETISEPGILDYNITYSDIVCHGDSGDMVIDVTGGTSPFFYTINNGTQINFADSSLIKMAPGVDTISVYDVNNCKAGLDTIIVFTDPPEIVLDSVYASEILCNGETADTLFFSGSADTLTLEYSINGVDYFSEGLFNDVPGGPITLYIRDLERGCIMMFDSSVYEPTPLVFDSILITNPSSDTSRNGGFDIYVSGGTAPYTFSIDSALTFDNNSTYDTLQTGTYYIYVRDANNCEIDTIMPLDYNIVNISYVFDRPSCNGFDDGFITVDALNGSAPYTYTLYDLSNNIIEQTNAIAQSSYTFDTLVAGIYQFDVEDNSGRISNKILIPLDDFDPVNFGSISITPIACNGYTIDTIILAGNGGTGIYEYAVDTLPYQNSGVFTDIPGGLVSLYVRDNNGCTFNVDTLITEPTPLIFDSVTTTITSGVGINDGTMTIYANGGTPPYEYTLNSGTFQPAPQFINLAEGFYDLTLRDANGCTADTVIEITSLKVTITSTEPLCNGTNTGTITISISPEGQPSFLYSIVGLPNNLVFSDSTTYVGDEYEHTFSTVRADTHSIYIQDGAGRVFETTYILGQPEPLSLDIVTGFADCQIPIDGTDVGTITIEVDGGTPDYVFNSIQDFTWLNDSTVEVQNLLAGEYTVNILDANGCSIDGDATVDPNPANIITINPSVSPASLPVCYGTTIDLSVNPVNATTVNWTDIGSGDILTEGEFLTYDIERTQLIIYTVENTVTGCMLDYLFTIPMYPHLNLSLIPDTILLKETSTYLIPELNTSLLDSTSFTWSSLILPSDIDYLNETNIPYPIFTAPEDVDTLAYQLRAVTNHNCVETDTIGIRVINVLKFPSGFSPNGDGVNDKWVPNQALLGRSKVEIFNRWGKQVFYSDGYSDPWDGTYNGKELPMGTYYYIVTIKVGKEETITGTVTIMR